MKTLINQTNRTLALCASILLLANCQTAYSITNEELYRDYKNIFQALKIGQDSNTLVAIAQQLTEQSEQNKQLIEQQLLIINRAFRLDLKNPHETPDAFMKLDMLFNRIPALQEQRKNLVDAFIKKLEDSI